MPPGQGIGQAPACVAQCKVGGVNVSAFLPGTIGGEQFAAPDTEDAVARGTLPSEQSRAGSLQTGTPAWLLAKLTPPVASLQLFGVLVCMFRPV